MIRFRTIDPAEQAKADEKAAAAKPAVAARLEPAEDGQAPDDRTTAASPPKAKGLTRTTPLRAKKPKTSGLFRD
ncbi:MAG: hypothetical protein Q8S58_01410 [Bosea sp. (in: a-proteobacteria)]|uniref:hypothetical protein n=1 Tax=Bosea sp. (in: a-proteobacteria) TaxID=1871050 RepID=UPI0027368C74|nr:hypothetical protein [Bosea sp. (in: a-proteobacteria)]MDP3257102.1 hypothetical protein [Bosea sp. (in: a-proteobacteria)]MDP3317761.1 hypothetical protein [Bosea sp. (in: a-proteobacteria)]